MKKLTKKYWSTLSESSKKRALTACFPNNPVTVQMMAKEEPDTKSGLWKIAFSMIRVPDADSHYKTVVNKVYYP